MILSIMMHAMKCTHTLPSLQIPRSTSNFSLPFRYPNLLGALHVGNDFLWHPKAFDPIVGLLVHHDGHHLVIFLLLLTSMVWRPPCPPSWFRCWRACLFASSLSSLFLPHFSPCTHRTCDLPCGTHSKPWFVLHQASSLP